MIGVFLILVVISISVAIATFKLQAIVQIIIAIVSTYFALGIYWVAGFYFQESYEPEMLIGWFVIASCGLFVVIPLSWILSKGIRKYKNASIT